MKENTIFRHTITTILVLNILNLPVLLSSSSIATDKINGLEFRTYTQKNDTDSIDDRSKLHMVICVSFTADIPANLQEKTPPTKVTVLAQATREGITVHHVKVRKPMAIKLGYLIFKDKAKFSEFMEIIREALSKEDEQAESVDEETYKKLLNFLDNEKIKFEKGNITKTVESKYTDAHAEDLEFVTFVEEDGITGHRYVVSLKTKDLGKLSESQTPIIQSLSCFDLNETPSFQVEGVEDSWVRIVGKKNIISKLHYLLFVREAETNIIWRFFQNVGYFLTAMKRVFTRGLEYDG